MEPQETPPNHREGHFHSSTKIPTPSQYSPDDYPERQNGLFNSWSNSLSGRKRSYSDIYAKYGNPEDPGTQIQSELDAAAEDKHDDKRSRGSGWPLKQNKTPYSSRSSKYSHTPRQDSARNRRWFGKSSKFLEGSMRDRESAAPPDEFLKEEMELEHNGHYSVDGTQQLHETGADLDAGIERSKSSGMYRFGRAFVHAFTPSRVLSGFFGKAKQDAVSENSLLEKRKLAAEEQYAELKKAGFQGTRQDVTRRLSNDTDFYGDSGIDMGSARSSNDTRRHGIIFREDGHPLLRPPPIPDNGTPSTAIAESAESAPSTEARAKRRSSLPGLKKLKSQFSLAALKKDPNSPMPSVEVDDHSQTLKKKQSKKEIQKQAKLSKKISNLETKLEKARHELNKFQEDDIHIKQENEEMQDFGHDEELETENSDEDVDTRDVAMDDVFEDDEEEENVIPIASPHDYVRSGPGRRFKPSLPSLPSGQVLYSGTRKSQRSSSRYPKRDLPPQTVNPGSLAFAIENALGMHEESEDMPKAKGGTTTKGNTKTAKTGESKSLDATPKAKKQTSKKRSKSSGTETDGKYKPPPEDDDDEGWPQSSKSKASPKKSSHAASTRKNMGETTPGKKVAPGSKRGTKSGPRPSKNQDFESIDFVLDKEVKSGYFKSALENAQLFAEATAYSPAMESSTRTPTELATDTARGSFKAKDRERSPTLQDIKTKNLSPLEALERSSRARSLAPPPTATFTRFSGAELMASSCDVASPTSHLRGGSLDQSQNAPRGLESSTTTPRLYGNSVRSKNIRNETVPSTPYRDESSSPLSSLDSKMLTSPPHQLDTPKRTDSSGSLRNSFTGSPTRTNSGRTTNGSPKPLKRAGHSGPITVTPSRGKGVPPVPRIPEGTVGKRAEIVKKARESNGDSVNLEDGWKGWDDEIF